MGLEFWATCLCGGAGTQGNTTKRGHCSTMRLEEAAPFQLSGRVLASVRHRSSQPMIRPPDGGTIESLRVCCGLLRLLIRAGGRESELLRKLQRTHAISQVSKTSSI